MFMFFFRQKQQINGFQQYFHQKQTKKDVEKLLYTRTQIQKCRNMYVRETRTH